MGRLLIWLLVLTPVLGCLVCRAALAASQTADEYIEGYNSMLPVLLERTGFQAEHLDELRGWFTLSRGKIDVKNLEGIPMYSSRGNDLYYISFPKGEDSPTSGFIFCASTDNPKQYTMLFKPFLAYFSMSVGIADPGEYDGFLAWLASGPSAKGTRPFGRFTAFAISSNGKTVICVH